MNGRIGAVMAAARKASGLSQSEMAAALGVSTVSVSKIENGHTAITLDRVQQWYRILNDQGRAVMQTMNIYAGV